MQTNQKDHVQPSLGYLSIISQRLFPPLNALDPFVQLSDFL